MKQKHKDFLDVSSSYAIFPTKTEDNGKIWFQKMWVVNDHRPVEYLGLLTIKTYFTKKENALKYYKDLIDII